MKFKKWDKVVYNFIILNFFWKTCYFWPKYYCKVTNVYESVNGGVIRLYDYRVMDMKSHIEEDVYEDALRKPKRYEYILYL